MSDGVQVLGLVTATLRDESGIIEVRITPNFLTELGEDYIADRLSDRDETDGDISHMAIGTGTGQDRTATALAAQVAIVALTLNYPAQGTGSDTNDVLWRATFAAGTPATAETITEGGLFSAVSAGKLINVFEFSPGITKGTSQSLQIDLTWTIGAG